MTASRTILFCAALGLLALGAASPALDFTAAEMAEGLAGFLKDKDDDNAIGLMEVMTGGFADLEEGDQKKLVKVVAKALSQRRPEGDDRLYIAALETLGKMGELGMKATVKSLKNNNVKKRREVLAAALLSLASHRDRKSIDVLIGFLVHSDAVVVAAVAEALSEYHLEEDKVRRLVVKELVKNFANIHSLAESRPKETVYRDRLNVVERPMTLALQKLTGQTLESATEWQKWYNDNKGKPWDQPQG